MNDKFKVFIVFIFPFFLLYSCSNNDIELSNEKFDSFMIDESNIALENLALLIQEANKSNQFRKELRTEVIKEYSLDYYLHQSKFKSENVENRIKKLLKNSSYGFNIEQLKEITDKLPNYEISVPVHCEAWDAENFDPLVAYVPIDFDKKSDNKIKAFDRNGKVIWLKTDEEPQLPIILIRPIEDVDYSNYTKSFEDGFKSSRINGASEFVKRLGTNNINEVESWIDGPYCEIKCITLKSDGSIASTDYFFPTRAEINNTFHTVNHKLIEWNKQYYGDAITMNWIEEDGGNPLTINLGYTDASGLAASVSYQIKNLDDQLGFKTVHFSDYVGMEYNTGKIKWILNSSIYCPYIGSFDGVNCYVGQAPSGSSAFVLNGNFYYTPVNGSCPYPNSWLDGANCYVSSVPSGAIPFTHNNKWYVMPYNF
jgi:hypothetical protein